MVGSSLHRSSQLACTLLELYMVNSSSALLPVEEPLSFQPRAHGHTEEQLQVAEALMGRGGAGSLARFAPDRYDSSTSEPALSDASLSCTAFAISNARDDLSLTVPSYSI